MKYIYLLLAMSAFSANVFAAKITCHHSGSTQYCYSWFTNKNRVTGKTKTYKINFNVDGDVVDTTSVCSNQKYGSIDSIICKREASDLFRKACRADRDNASLSRSRKRLYCDAYSSFVPSR